MARLTQHGLKRVLGTSALFSTAYGNVGSSIYYALGLVASYALGLTPIVFLITGVIFYLTAATYAEATAMYPEAGGSSSFARHAFNELWSFFAAWAQMLNYTITIAISAFFVPHYLGGLFWPALQHGPGDVVFGIGVVMLLSVVNVVGVKEAAGLNIVLAVTDLATQLLLVVVGMLLVLSPHVLIQNVHLGVAPTWKNFLVAIPVGMIAYTGIETISNMAEEARDETKTIPKAIKAVVAAVFAIYAALPMVALSALPVTKGPNGEYTTLLGTDEAHGGFAGDPVLGIVKHLHLGHCSRPGRSTWGSLPRRSSSSRPTPGSSAPRGWSTRWACTARCPIACPVCIRSSARHGSGSCCSGRSPASRSSPARPNSSATCTRSGRCSRSRSPTCR